METLDAIAKRYGVRPSQVIGESDELKAFSIDLWAHNWGVQAEAALMRKMQRQGNRGRS